VVHALPAAAAAPAGAGGNGGPSNGDAGTTADEDEVVDAEFTRE
jgi:hypothetical protein